MARRKSNQRNGLSTRRYGGRPRIPTFLIVCEGEKTEPNYFRKFRVKTRPRIEIVGTGFNTLSLVQKTVEIKETEKKNNKSYNQVWCVFDEDGHPPEDIDPAFKLAKANNIEIAFSNESFELWYLLHFSYNKSKLNRKQYNKKLDKLLGQKYEKNSQDMYDILEDKQQVAIKNAKKLYDSYKPYKAAQNKPCTTVFKLVQRLNKHIK